MTGLIAKKVGMTQVFDENGNLIPVTVIRVEPNSIPRLHMPLPISFLTSILSPVEDLIKSHLVTEIIYFRILVNHKSLDTHRISPCLHLM